MSRCCKVIAFTSHFGFHELVNLKLGQVYWMSNLTFRLVSCTWGKKMNALSQCVITLSHLQSILVPVTLKSGQGHWMSNLTFGLVSYTCSKKLKALSEGVSRLSRLQAILVSMTWWPWNWVKVTESRTRPSDWCHIHEVKKWRSRRYEVIALTSICTARPLARLPARPTASPHARTPARPHARTPAHLWWSLYPTALMAEE